MSESRSAVLFIPILSTRANKTPTRVDERRASVLRIGRGMERGMERENVGWNGKSVPLSFGSFRNVMIPTLEVIVGHICADRSKSQIFAIPNKGMLHILIITNICDLLLVF